jgi:hypothetical protein
VIDVRLRREGGPSVTLQAVPERDRIYSDEDVKAILGRALDRQRAAQPEGLSHEELLAVARDAGIPLDAVEAAAADHIGGRDAEAEALAVRKERASDFRIHLFTYIPVIAFLIFVNLMTSHYPWVLWPALGWGLALVLHARFAIYPTDVEIAHDVEARQRQRRRAEEKRRRREAKGHLRAGARDLSDAVTRGVGAILEVTAKRIHEEVDAAIGEPSAERVRVEPSVRVDSPQEPLEEEDAVDEARKARKS